MNKQDEYNLEMQRRLHACSAFDFNHIRKTHLLEQLARFEGLPKPSPEIQQRLAVLRKSNTEKLDIALGHAMSRLSGEQTAALLELRQPSNFALLAATLAFWSEANRVPLSHVLEVSIPKLDRVLTGGQAIEVVQCVAQFGSDVLNAADDDRLSLAGAYLANRMMQYGFEVLFAMLTRDATVSVKQPE
ncbi:hypothetical protein HZU77_012750 [Neisseriaceae bacterium TC5R-5]|nr:hypothetical protein [Neisseriaceae bacterium TC5R-5]